MNKDITQIIDAVSEAFNVGSKTIRDIYPVIKQQYVVYSICNNFISAMFAFILISAITTAILIMVYSYPDYCDRPKIKKYITVSFVVAILSIVIMMTATIISLVYAPDYNMFINLLGDR